MWSPGLDKEHSEQHFTTQTQTPSSTICPNSSLLLYKSFVTSGVPFQWGKTAIQVMHEEPNLTQLRHFCWHCGHIIPAERWGSTFLWSPTSGTGRSILLPKVAAAVCNAAPNSTVYLLFRTHLKIPHQLLRKINHYMSIHSHFTCMAKAMVWHIQWLPPVCIVALIQTLPVLGLMVATQNSHEDILSTYYSET